VEAVDMVWSTYTSRIKRGWSHERAIGAPVPKSTSPSGKAGPEQEKQPSPAEIFNRLEF